MWGEGVRCVVALSFDVDAETIWMTNFRQPTPGPLSRGEYGPRVGVPRILKLLDTYEIKASFFIPGWTAEHYPHVVESIYAKSHEIGHHGYLHELAHRLEEGEERRVLELGTACLRQITGEVPRGYRSPAGNLSPNTLRLLSEYGFTYDSSLTADDWPYFLTIDGRQTRLVELPWSWELDDAPHFLFSFYPYHTGLAAPSKVFEIWASEFDIAYEEGGLYSLVMHPQVIGRRHRMRMLEELIRHMRARPGVSFARHIDIAQLWLQNHAP
jgi:peptidoglycan/xylan/chitin deacetylase (PgdA/CDA1 family)